MSFLNGLFRSLLNNLIISMLFGLVGISLFVGDFPPTVSKVKKVFAEYQSLIQLKQRIGNQSDSLETDQLVVQLENGREQQLRKLASSRSSNDKGTFNTYYDQLDQVAAGGAVAQVREPQAEIEIKEAPPTKVQISKEWQDQFYHLRAEVQRLNQRVLELEKQKAN